MEQNARSVLNEYWGHKDFRGSQQHIIDTLLSQRDVLTLMPTGGGKSVCYQVPGLLMEGICIVVSPLVALIQNQVDELKFKGIKAIALSGGIPFDELNNLLDNCLYGDYKFLYLSPERLQQPLIQERIKGMNVNLIAIDEAHCISQWGNDFRPAYLECSILRTLKPRVPVIALTATATPRVAKDIVSVLGLKEVQVFKDSFKRKNIAFSVKQTEDKWFQLQTLLHKASGSSIIYVRSRKKSAQLSDALNKQGLKSTFYHGGVLRAEKEKRLNDWLNNQVKIMVATNAFGMGVDKPDVRLVVHYQIPDSLESYFQEAGRAGRDGKESKAITLTNEEDKLLAQQQFPSSLPNAGYLKQLYRHLCNFFQVPYGELPLEPFPLNFNQFCQQYQLNANKTYQGLRLLDQNSVIALSETSYQRTALQFVASKRDIFAYFEKHPKKKSFIQTILRTYGGITEFETKVDTLLLSKKTGIPETNILKHLQQLYTDGIIEYKFSTSDLEITFLVPREDDRTINSFAKRIDDLHTVKAQNLKHMLSYLDNQTICRSKTILNYFGERNALNCGKCDICTREAVLPNKADRAVILEALRLKPLSSRQLLVQLNMDEPSLLKNIQSLLEDEVIQLNSENEYVIIRK
nr:ATP-dependent DNA helicase RecQ [Allomuricauda sp.]